MAKKVSRTCQLTTPFEENAVLNWQEYPRPQFKRDSYLSLCGAWQLAVKNADVVTSLGDIIVPYPPESRISGINRNLVQGEQYIYTKAFVLDGKFNAGKVLLHFGAVDQLAKVWVNGSFAGEHIGGYLPFSFDV
ncbi:MAG: glycoside hydrolase family 2, partial [Ruminococcus sp.]|nr:glycoside hydrolase family 2 [Ruminococcus sp.]